MKNQQTEQDVVFIPAGKSAEEKKGRPSGSVTAGRLASRLIQPAALSSICHLMADMTAELWAKHSLNPNAVSWCKRWCSTRRRSSAGGETWQQIFQQRLRLHCRYYFFFFFLSIWFQINWYWLLVPALRRTRAINHIASPRRLSRGHILPSCSSRTVFAVTFLIISQNSR